MPLYCIYGAGWTLGMTLAKKKPCRRRDSIPRLLVRSKPSSRPTPSYSAEVGKAYSLIYFPLRNEFLGILPCEGELRKLPYSCLFIQEVRINSVCLSVIIGLYKELMRWAFKYNVFFCYPFSRGKKSIISTF